MVRRDRSDFWQGQVIQIGTEPMEISNPGSSLQISWCSAVRKIQFQPDKNGRFRGIRSKTSAYRVGYAITKPALPLPRRFFPRYILSTEEIGRAMLYVAKRGAPKSILETWDIRDCSMSSNKSPMDAKAEIVISWIRR
jgi:hypothetical protein